jgi:molybdenum cofactor biosynthesis enzyme MoaA
MIVGCMLVKGNFDLYITNVCNLHCKNCIVLDYKGRVTIPHLSLEEIKEIIEKIPVQLEQLQLVGGEPTLHPEFVQIVHYLEWY